MNIEVPQISFDASKIPKELKGRRQWICWRYEVRDDKLVKVPLAPWTTGHNGAASVTDPNNMATFETAVDYASTHGWGIGFCFFSGDRLTGIDFDKITEEAKSALEKAGSYAEYSPSGKGVHIIGLGKVDGFKKADVEVYSRDRFFTVTGNHVEETPLHLSDIQTLLDDLEAKYGDKRFKIKSSVHRGDFVNQYGWSLEEIRKRDTKLDDLLSGLHPAGYKSPSEADMATLSKLQFWAYSESEAVDILKHFRGRKKLERENYINKTLKNIGVTQSINDLVNPKKWNPTTGYHVNLENERRPREKVTKLGEYSLEKKGSKAVLFDKNGEAVTSCNIVSVDGPRFKKQLKEKTGLGEIEIDKITANFVLLLQEKNTSTPKKEEQLESLSPEDIEQTEKLLHDPQLLCRIAETLHGPIGLVGETKNALLTYLTMISSRLEDPVNLRWSSRASIGKSTIVTRVAQLFPPEDLIMKTGLTKKSAYYMHEAEDIDAYTRRLVLHGKVLVLLEESESQEFLSEVKPLLSHDKPTLEYDFVEEKVTRTVRLEGWPAYIGITTAPIKGEEHETRTLLATPDRGKEKYGAVIKNDAERHAYPWIVGKPELQPFHELVRRLKPVKVAIPWLPVVAKYFPRQKASSMRDWKKLRTYIQAVTFLHQKQRPSFKLGDEEYVVAIPLDLEITKEIVEGAMAETMMGLERDVKDFYEHIKEHTPVDTFFTYKSLMEQYEKCFGESIGRTTLRRRYIEKLEDCGLLEIDEAKKPYKITFSTETLTSLTNFEKALEEIRSEQTKAEIIQKRLCTTEGAQDNNFLETFEKYYSYTLSLVDNLKSLLKRRKEEEYPEKGFFVDSVKEVNDSRQKKPTLSNGKWHDER